MKSPTIRPRTDQILELTRGLQLPLPAIQSIHLEVIAEVLARAYQDVGLEHCSTVASGSEAEITALLEARLNTLIDHDVLWQQLAGWVARGKESLSFDGSHLEKRPDLSIYLTDRHRNFPLIAEAKIIDAGSSKTEKLYCENGICRFVNGEYAWATREAFMLAYVRDGSTITSKLTPFLSNEDTQAPSEYSVDELPTHQGVASIDLARSKHSRGFAYVHQPPPKNTPGPIALWHIWIA